MRRWGVGKKFCLRGQGRSYVGERGRQLCIFFRWDPADFPQAAPSWGRSYQVLSAGRLIRADNTDMLSTPS